MSSDSPPPPPPTTNSQNGSYLDELLKELQTMTDIYEHNKCVKFRNAHNLLVREIQRVWDAEMRNGEGPPGSPSTGRLLLPRDDDGSSSPHGGAARRESHSPQGRVEKSDKIFFPPETPENNNPIGRLIGPRGMTIRQLERDLACKLYIRGRGCTKDDSKEERLRGRPGWEHLEDPIHVQISVRGESEEECAEKLASIKTRLGDFLEHPDFDLKRAQLMQLAVIEGNLK